MISRILTRVTQQEIESVMPDYIKAQYDGTTDSLYNIIESEIEKLLGEDSPSKEETTSSVDETIVSTDEETKPVRRGLPSRRKAENSEKPRSIKALLKKHLAAELRQIYHINILD